GADEGDMSLVELLAPYRDDHLRVRVQAQGSPGSRAPLRGRLAETGRIAAPLDDRDAFGVDQQRLDRRVLDRVADGVEMVREMSSSPPVDHADASQLPFRHVRIVQTRRVVTRIHDAAEDDSTAPGRAPSRDAARDVC